MPRRYRSLIAAFASALVPTVGVAQTVLERSPNLAGAWTGASGVLHFNFLHRFSISSAPERKVTSTPTFLLAAGLPYRTLAGVHYATNSELSPRYPNEWELFGRFAAVDQETGAPVDASIQVGYNLAAEGLDGEAAVARRQGALRVLAAVRLLADPEGGGADVALGTGVVARLTRHLGVSADVVAVTDRGPGERVAWGAGLNLAIPRTPHTISLHATNVNNATLQSSSRGTNETRYGFEFTIPLTLSRYFGREPTRPAVSPMRADTAATAGDITTALMHDFLFRPARLEVKAGTTIVWTNQGQVVHTVTADDGSFDSGSVEPGQQDRITFSRPGTYAYHCTPHPFMRGEIVVR
ncbi:MAG TPA: cupredoxin family copper-binding protein [Gemmatimonadales bacterium]|nr:cupredoxin family copper-binding protein [Gemmatimonadales bacterium]